MNLWPVVLLLLLMLQVQTFLFNSILAGPKEDIIGGTENQVGFLAKNEEEYATFVENAMINFDRMK